MHSFRLRYVVLGLLIYLQNAFCRTCGSKFDDIASRVVSSDIVFEGRLGELTEQDKTTGEYVYEYKPSEIFRGEDKLPRSRRDSNKYRTVPVGIFQGNCSAGVDRTKKYIVFLNATLSETFYRWTALPVQASRKVKRDIQKTVQCLPKCAKEPKVRLSPQEANSFFEEGKTLQLKCRYSAPSGSPVATIQWFKDGQLLEKSKKYKYKSKGKSSRLRIRKVSGRDSGTYSCRATSINGFAESQTIVTVYNRGERPPPGSKTSTTSTQITSTPTAIPTTSTTTGPTDYHSEECEVQTYCLNGGTCFKHSSGNVYCKCASNFAGFRCQIKNPVTNPDVRPTNNGQQFDRQMTILGLVVGVLVLLAVCIAGYCMAREKRKAYRKKIAERRRLQNLYTNGTHRTNKPGTDENTKELLQPITAATTGIELKHMFPSAYDAGTQTEARWYDHMSPADRPHPVGPPLFLSDADQPFGGGGGAVDNAVLCPEHYTLTNECHLSAPELQSFCAMLPAASAAASGAANGSTATKPEEFDMMENVVGHQSLANAATVNTVMELEPDQHSSHSSPNQSQNSRTESAHDGIPSLKDDKDPGFELLCPVKTDEQVGDLMDMTNLLEESKSSLEAALIEFDAQSDYDNQRSSDLEVNVESEPDPLALEEFQSQGKDQQADGCLFRDSAGEESDSDSSAAEEQALFHKLKSRNSSVTSSDQDAGLFFGQANGCPDNGWQNAYDNQITNNSPRNYAFNPYASDEEQTGNNYFGNFGTPSCSRRGSQGQNELTGNDLILKNPLLFDPDPDATPL